MTDDVTDFDAPDDDEFGEVVDLDAFLSEHDGKGPKFKACGRTWTIPTDVPADTMARLSRVQMDVTKAMASGLFDGLDDASKVPDGLMEQLDEVQSPLQVLRKLIGDELVDELVEAGIGNRAAAGLSGAALTYYQTGVWRPPGAQGNLSAPRGAKQPTDRKAKSGKHSAGPKSGGTGGRSKPTSKANTA